MRASHPASFAETLVRCRKAAKLTMKAVAYELRIMPQTVSRWESEQRAPSAAKVRALIRYFHSLDPALAQALADAQGQPLTSYGIVPPQPVVQSAAPQQRITPRHAADSLVCAASEATQLGLQETRRALLAGFRRAREMGFTIEFVEQGLATAIEERGGMAS
jgi:transcriptional regulator with XRE-family HTH domain